MVQPLLSDVYLWGRNRSASLIISMKITRNCRTVYIELNTSFSLRDHSPQCLTPYPKTSVTISRYNRIQLQLAFSDRPESCHVLQQLWQPSLKLLTCCPHASLTFAQATHVLSTRLTSWTTRTRKCYAVLMLMDRAAG